MKACIAASPALRVIVTSDILQSLLNPNQEGDPECKEFNPKAGNASCFFKRADAIYRVHMHGCMRSDKDLRDTVRAKLVEVGRVSN
jgi:hypothetical protein